MTDPASGEYEEQTVFAYRDALLELFADSPEGIASSEQGGEIG